MPGSRPLHDIGRRLLDRWPGSRDLGLAVFEPIYHVALWPFGRRVRAGSSAESPELVACTEAYNPGTKPMTPDPNQEMD